MNMSPVVYGSDGFAFAESNMDSNSLFVDGRVVPPMVNSSFHGSDARRKFSVPSCLC